ncbi:MAG TPA: hypothetical protein ENG12_05880 [Candidatus Altiarchaeales archaeon]|nr:hypothetical protein [Candidatus Altiarchaeales archaeon]
MKPEKLNWLELDALREISSVGAGHASTALSVMTNKRVNVTFPWMKMCPLENVTSVIGKPEREITNIYLHINGRHIDKEFEICSLILAFPIKSAVLLARLLQGEEPGAEELTEMDRSTLREIGNIMVGNYLSAMAEYLDIELIESVPAIASDMLDSVMDPILAQHASEVEDALVFSIKFIIEGQEIIGYFVVLFYSHMRLLLKNIKYFSEIEDA